MNRPTDKELKAKLERVTRAINLPVSKWEERDGCELRGMRDMLLWVLGYQPEPKSPEAGI